jgi:hypothetical protein
LRDALKLGEQTDAISVFAKGPLLVNRKSGEVMNRVREIDAFLSRHSVERSLTPGSRHGRLRSCSEVGAPAMAKTARV